MSQQNTNLNKSPYFDDYDEEKKFLRVLYQAGRTVQLRELTQSQTILSNQISRLGDYVFQDGSVVIPGQFAISEPDLTIGITLDDADAVTGFDLDSGELYVQSITVDNEAATISHVLPASGSDPVTLIGNRTGSGTPWVVGDQVQVVGYDEDTGVTQRITYGVITSIEQSTIAKITEGVFYTRGFFVLVDEQEIIVSKHALADNVAIGLDIAESIVTADDDSSLNSNATGTTNFNAPGADRFKITLTLNYHELADDISDFIELTRVVDREYSETDVQTTNSVLGDTLAQRTYEQSGNFNTQSYKIRAIETDSDDSKVNIRLSNGVSYVKGYRQDLDGTSKTLTIDKARTTKSETTKVTLFTDTRYLELASEVVSGQIFGCAYAKMFVGSTEVGVMTSPFYRPGSIGSLMFNSYTFTNTDYNINEVNRFIFYSLSDNIVGAIVCTVSAIASSSNRTNVKKLPYDYITTLQPEGAGTITGVFARSYTVTLDSDGYGTINVGSGNVVQINSTQYMVGSPVNHGLTLADVVAGTITNEGETVVGGTLTVADGGGSTAGQTVQIHSSNYTDVQYSITLPVLTTSPALGTKTKTTVTANITFTSAESSVVLPYSDVVELVSATDSSGNDVLDQFTLQANDNSVGYYPGEMVANIAGTAGTFTFEYTYYKHSANADFFTVDSYIDAEDYADIPTLTINGTETRLSDCVDFRPMFNGVDSPESETSRYNIPNSEFGFDVKFYLSRIDVVSVSPSGEYAIKTGIPAVDPTKPVAQTDVMELYSITLPPYTADVGDISFETLSTNNYTMVDISNLESRIASLEYQASLNSLEQEIYNSLASNTVSETFTNGIFSDPFTDLRLMDLGASHAMYDPENGVLWPQYKANGQNMTVNTLDGVENDESVLGLVYDEYTMASNTSVTDFINVNPYASYSWVGALSLTPNKDYWVDTTYTSITINATGNSQSNVEAIFASYANTISSDIVGSWTGTKYFSSTNSLHYGYYSASGEAVTEESAIKYMRAVDIEFEATGLRPNFEVHAWFQSRLVDEFCTPDGGSLGGTLRTDVNGTVKGVFSVPDDEDNKFETGENTMIISSSAETSEYNDVDISTWANAKFDAEGEKQTITRYKITVRNADPVAQSFLTSSETGGYITGVGVFFGHKSSTIPVTCQLRTIENGVPTTTIIAEKTLTPDEVNVSSTGLVETRFNFDYPVHLDGDAYYCFVIIANCQDYTVAYATMGGTDINTGQGIATNPYVGTFFKSANTVTWTEDQTSDMTFKIYAAKFGTNTNATALLDAVASDYEGLPANCLTLTADSTTAKISAYGHGLAVGDSFELEGFQAAYGIPSTDFNKTQIATAVTPISIEFEVATAAEIAIGDSVNVLSDAGQYSINAKYRFSHVYLKCAYDIPESCGVDFEFRYRVFGSGAYTEWLPLSMETETYLESEGELSSAADIQVRATFNTTDENLTPQIDLSSLNLAVIGYLVVSDEADRELGSYYTTNTVELDESANQLTVYSEGVFPSGSNLLAYAYLETSDGVFTEVEMELTTPIQYSSTSAQDLQFVLPEAVEFTSVYVRLYQLGTRTQYPQLYNFRGIAYTA